MNLKQNSLHICSIDYKIASVHIDNNVTSVMIQDLFTGELFEGLAKCHKEDEIDYNVGVEIATRRAVLEMVSARVHDEIARHTTNPKALALHQQLWIDDLVQDVDLVETLQGMRLKS